MERKMKDKLLVVPLSTLLSVSARCLSFVSVSHYLRLALNFLSSLPGALALPAFTLGDYREAVPHLTNRTGSCFLFLVLN